MASRYWGSVSAPPNRFNATGGKFPARCSTARRIAHYLERQGLLERDVEGAWLTSSAGGEENESAIHHLRHPILMEPRM